MVLACFYIASVLSGMFHSLCRLWMAVVFLVGSDHLTLVCLLKLFRPIWRTIWILFLCFCSASLLSLYTIVESRYALPPAPLAFRQLVVFAFADVELARVAEEPTWLLELYLHQQLVPPHTPDTTNLQKMCTWRFMLHHSLNRRKDNQSVPGTPSRHWPSTV